VFKKASVVLMLHIGSPIWGNKSPAPDTIQWHPSDREKVIRFYHTWPVESRTTTGPKVEVHVKKFIPQEDDLTSRRYRIAGGYAQADRPHYATVEPTEKLSKDLLKWVEKNKGNLLSIYNFGREVEVGRDTRRLMELAIKFGRENKVYHYSPLTSSVARANRAKGLYG
jgi:hypothetical protein